MCKVLVHLSVGKQYPKSNTVGLNLQFEFSANKNIVLADSLLYYMYMYSMCMYKVRMYMYMYDYYLQAMGKLYKCNLSYSVLQWYMSTFLILNANIYMYMYVAMTFAFVSLTTTLYHIPR